MNKYLSIFILAASLISCSVPRRNVAKLIYENQRAFYDQNIDNRNDFKPIIDFAKKGRGKLYRANNFSFSKNSKYILLEGFANSSGRYEGIVLFDGGAVAYHNSPAKKWQFSILSSRNADSLEYYTGISHDLISTVAERDTLYIENLKHSVGNVVSDGSTFIATYIDNTDISSPKLKTIGFYEFQRSSK